uniref:hypothetical protein n=1 Tax=Staphylococcus gallinarum TaxID=1293 RepID=UPI0039F6E3D3
MMPMRIIGYTVGVFKIKYIIKTDKGEIFTYKLPKDMSPLKARRKLKLLAGESKDIK